MFWKIDYYRLDEDGELDSSSRSEDEANADITCRVMTIGLAEDY